MSAELSADYREYAEAITALASVESRRAQAMSRADQMRSEAIARFDAGQEAEKRKFGTSERNVAAADESLGKLFVDLRTSAPRVADAVPRAQNLGQVDRAAGEVEAWATQAAVNVQSLLRTLDRLARAAPAPVPAPAPVVPAPSGNGKIIAIVAVIAVVLLIVLVAVL
ncbi:hypothetical protein [Gordonia iterans]